MASAARICWSNNVTTAAITGGSEALPASNMAGDQGSPSTAWQTVAGTTTSWAVFDSGSSATTWQLFGLFRTNLTTAATIRWRIGAALSGGTLTGGTTYDSTVVSAGVVAGYGQTVTAAAAAATGRYCQVDIVDSANPDTFLNIPLAFAGPAWSPAVAPSWSQAFGRDDQTDEVVSRGGQEYPTNRWVRRRYVLRLEGVKQSELWASQGELDRFARTGGNVLIVPNTASATMNQESIFGRLRGQSDVTFPTMAGDARAWGASVTERL